MDLTSVFTDAFWAAAAIISTMVTGFVNQALNIENGKLKRVVSWVIPVIASVAAWYFGFVTFTEPVWVGVGSLALVVALSSNGIYTFGFMKNWISTWFSGSAEKKEKVKADETEQVK